MVFGELLAVQTDIYQIERVVVIEKGNAGQLASDRIISVETLGTDPVTVFAVFREVFGVAFEADRNAFDEVSYFFIQWHVYFQTAVSGRGSAVGLECLKGEF